MRKGFAPIVIVISLILLIPITYLIFLSIDRPWEDVHLTADDLAQLQGKYTSPTPTPLSSETANPDLIGANWKTYKNSHLGFTIKYPEDWLINDCGGVDISLAPSTQLLGVCESGSPGLILIQTGLDSTNYADEIKQLNPSDYDNFQKTIIADKEAIKTSIVQKEDTYVPKGTKSITYSINFNGRVLRINYIQLPKWGDYSKTFDQILSTFKFIN